MSILISQADSSDYAMTVDILTDAFASDPGFLRLIPQPDENNAKLRRLFEVQISKQYGPVGMVDLARNEHGEILGAALWDGPDDNHGAVEQASLLPHLISIFGVSAARLVLSEFSSARQHPKFPHWYLYTIATTAAARGQGVGSALLNHGISRAGEEAIYLEATSTRSAQLYHRLGFVPLGYIPDHDDLDSELAMWKPPAMPTL